MSRALRWRRSSSVSILPGTGRCPQGGGVKSSPITPWFELESFRPLRQPAAATSPFRGGFCGSHVRYPINASAICTALSAAPLRRLSPTANSARPCGTGCPGALDQHRHNRSRVRGRFGGNGGDRQIEHGRAPSQAPTHCKCFCCGGAARLVRGDEQPESGARLICQGSALARSGVLRRQIGRSGHRASQPGDDQRVYDQHRPIKPVRRHGYGKEA